MPWFRLDDSFHSHPKVIAAGNEAVGLFVRCGTYAAEHTTDGIIAEEIAELYGASATGSRRNPGTGKPETLAETLVRTGLWHRVRRGWTIHDYLDYNPSRAAVEKERKDAAERQRRRRGLDRGFTSKVPVDNRENGPVDSRNRSPDGTPSRRDSRSDTAVSHTTPTRRVGRTESHPPDPLRPDGRAGPAGPADRAARPPWCGECDEATRMLDPDRPRRCPDCHPLAVQAQVTP
jgi:hypothetical protein